MKYERIKDENGDDIIMGELAIKIWNASIEACVGRVRNDVYHEAQDTEWDLGFNKAKAMCIAELEKEKK